MENIYLDYVMVNSIMPMESSLGDQPKEEQIIHTGPSSGIIDPESGEPIVFQDYVKKQDLPEETIISDSDFAYIFGE